MLVQKEKLSKENQDTLNKLFHTSKCKDCNIKWQKLLGKNPHPKDRRGGLVFCCGFQFLDDNGCCPACKREWKRKPTYKQMLDRFNLVIQENIDLINEKFIGMDIINLKEINFKLPMPIGKKIYFVPLVMFAQLYNIQDNEKELEPFFEHLKESCKSYDIKR